MLSNLRRIARPSSIVLLLAFVAPQVPAECQALAGASGDSMSCCIKAGSDRETFDSTCCSVQPTTPAPDRAPAPVPAERHSEGKLSGASTPPGPGAAPISPAVSSSTVMGAGPPADRLYLRLSVIRR